MKACVHNSNPRHSHVDFVDWLADTTSFSVAVQFPPPPTRSWKAARRLRMVTWLKHEQRSKRGDTLRN